MVDSDPLFSLIQSLGKAEKRYFRLYVTGISGKDGNQYLVLFDAMRKMKVFDHEMLQKKMEGHSLVTYLPTARNYLYRLILKSMRAYSSEKSPHRQLRGLISDAVYLYDKTLYKQSYKVIRKARKIAEKIGDLNSKLEILTWERKLIKLTGGAARAEEIQSLIVEEAKVLRSKQNYHAFYGLLDRAYMVANHSHNSRGSELRNKIEAILNHPIMSEPPVEMGFHSMWFYYQTMALCYHVLGQYEQARHHLASAGLWWEAHPAMIEADVPAYRSLLANLSQVLAALEDWDKIPRIMEKMRKLPIRSETDGVLLDQHIYQIEFHRTLNLGLLEEAMLLSERIEPWLNKNKNLIAPGRLVTFHYNLMVLQFLHGNFRKSLDWANSLVENQSDPIRSDLRHTALLLQLVIYFELDLEDLLEYRFRSVYRYFYQRGNLHSFENLVLSAMRRLARYPGSQIRPEIFQEILNTVVEYKKSNSDAPAPGLEELLIWLKSKTLSLPIRQVSKSSLARK